MGREDDYQYPWTSHDEEDHAEPFLPVHPMHSGPAGPLGPNPPKVGTLSWSIMWKATVEFLSHPVNIFMTVWTILMVPACVVLGLDYAGLWTKIVTDKRVAEHWVEICTQVANALAALMCLICIPLLVQQTVQLIRWNSTDKVDLRQFYCRNGTRKPHDRTHIAVVVLFAHVACIATFVFTAVYWVYPTGQRPQWLVNITFGLSFAAPVISVFYLFVSPLSKNYDIVKDADAQNIRMYERTTAFFVEERPIVIGQARWNGRVFPGCCSHGRVAICATVFPCCLFGYNMERLGLGHRAVHASAFFVVLVGPILLFAPAAAALRESGITPILLMVAGVVVGLIGLSYGGLWRAKMRAKMGLPGDLWTDLCLWMWCGLCSLCQEIRTLDQYEIGEASTFKGANGYVAPSQSVKVAVVPMEEEDYPEDPWTRPSVSISRTSCHTRAFTNPLIAQKMEP